MSRRCDIPLVEWDLACTAASLRMVEKEVAETERLLDGQRVTLSGRTIEAIAVLHLHGVTSN